LQFNCINTSFVEWRGASPKTEIVLAEFDNPQGGSVSPIQPDDLAEPLVPMPRVPMPIPRSEQLSLSL